MFITEFFEAREPRNLVVIYAGRFQPFHKGHQAVYNYLVKQYGRDHVFISTSNKIDPPKSPFSFTDKSYFMQMMGIPMDRVVESSQPYTAKELLNNYDLDNTVVLIAVSEKDMAEDPRFKPGFKKNGDPTYYQELPKDLKQAAPASQHGYIAVVPTFDFKVLGQPMRSASEIRAMYSDSDAETRKKIIADLFGAYTQEAEHIMSTKLVKEDSNMPAAVDSISPIHGGTVQEGEVIQFPKKQPPNLDGALKLAHHIVNVMKDESAIGYHEQIAQLRSQLKRLGYHLRFGIDGGKQGAWLVNPATNFKTVVELFESASGYIPKNSKEAKDPRWSHALTTDIKTDTVKKELKAFFPTKAPKTQQKQVTESEDGNDLSKLRKTISDIEWKYIEDDRNEIDYYQGLIHQHSSDPESEQLVAAWKRKIEKLRARIKSYFTIK
jgi:hypothetical protein